MVLSSSVEWQEERSRKCFALFWARWKTRGRGPGVWKTRGLVENAGTSIFLPKYHYHYEFSSLKREGKILLAYIVMNINSAPRPQLRC